MPQACHTRFTNGGITAAKHVPQFSPLRWSPKQQAEKGMGTVACHDGCGWPYSGAMLVSSYTAESHNGCHALHLKR